MFGGKINYNRQTIIDGVKDHHIKNCTDTPACLDTHNRYLPYWNLDFIAMIIDMHSHWLPADFIEVLRSRMVAPRIAADDNGRDYLHQARGSFPLPSDYGFLEKRLATMEKYNIDCSVFSISGVFGLERIPVAESLPLIKTFNETVSKLHEKHPDRIFGLTTLPIGDIDLSVSELDAALKLPGIIGCLLPGNAFLTLERAEPFKPLFEVAQKYAAHILIHTGFLPNDTSMPPGPEVDNERARRVTLDMQSRISSNMITFCLTDYLTEYSDVTVQCHNLGGNIPYEIDRMDHISLDREPDLDPPSVQIKNSKVMVDCNSMGATSIERAVEVYGAHRIVYGSDGTAFGADWTNKAINDARISTTDKEAIFSGNAKSIVGLR